MILHIENPKYIIRKLLELISEFSKVEGYKTKTQKSLAFLYTNNETSEMQIKGKKTEYEPKMNLEPFIQGEVVRKRRKNMEY